MDWNDYIPPPVPDDQNFLKAPKMQEWFQELDVYKSNIRNEITGLSTNKDIATTITNKTDASNFLAWSSQYIPQFNLLREALKRPYVRIDGDYSKPFETPMVNFVAIRSVSQALAQRAKCHLLIDQTTNALDDVTSLNDFRRILELPPSRKPMSLINAMIYVAVTGLYANTIADGLQSHTWQEPQLIVLQKQLENINLAPFLVNATKTENAQSCYLIETNLIANNDESKTHIIRGWLLENLVTITRFDQQAINAVDLSNNVVFPDVLNDLERQEIALSKHPNWPTRIIALIAIPSFTKAWQTTAHYQTLVNETQIACALERYRLMHGEYPESLDVLVPQFIQVIPHDIIGGQPLHYSRTNDGKFLLYSVGWNEIDDSGLASPHNEFGTVTNYATGDWVWPN